MFGNIFYKPFLKLNILFYFFHSVCCFQKTKKIKNTKNKIIKIVKMGAP